jgi:hypothetical protein
MATYKALTLLILVIINQGNKCESNKETFANETTCESIIFYTKGNTLTLKKNEFVMKQNKAGFDININNKEAANSICKLINPTMEFCISNKKNIAIGNDVFSSSVPKGVNYFFPLNKERSPILFQGTKLQVSRISKS